MKKIIIFIIFISISYASGPGSTGANYLRIGIGAKAAGMGEAQVAIADNVDAIYWNPAGLSLIKSDEVGAMHLFYWQGINYEYLAYAIPIKDIGTFGIGMTYLNSGSIDKTIENPTSTDYIKEGTFNYIAFSGIISYANKFIIEKVPINLGANLKIIGDKIEEDVVLGGGLDLGVICKVMKDLTIGATVSNIGVLFRGNVLLPLTFKVGAGYKLELFDKKHCLTAAVDGILPVDYKIKADTGLEYTYDNMIFVRGGYKINYDLEGVTFGAGFRTNVDKTQYELNYAFTLGKEDVGHTHRISLIVRFGLPLLKEISEPQE